MTKALLLDCDGVLAETEQYGHLVAFNQMWREFGVPWQWSVEEYGRKLKIGGGKERMASLFTEPVFLACFRPPDSAAARHELLAVWHQRKTEIYRQIIETGAIPPRSGVKRLVVAALAHGWRVGVASTSAVASVEAVLRQVVGKSVRRQFALLLAGDIVPAKKPAPDIYHLAAQELMLAPQDCVAIEDSRNGLLAAHQAGMPVIITPSRYTQDEDFSEAALVLSCLGDPDGERCEVRENRSLARPGPYFSLTDLEAISQGCFSAVPRAGYPI
jgi:HAD superfamily hydrolase (TIGR01509 family)